MKRRNSKWKVESCEGSGTAESRRVTRLGKRGNRDCLTRDWLKILSCKHIKRALLGRDWLLRAKMPRIVDAKRRMCHIALFLLRQVSCLFYPENSQNPQIRYLFFSTQEEPCANPGPNPRREWAVPICFSVHQPTFNVLSPPSTHHVDFNVSAAPEAELDQTLSVTQCPFLSESALVSFNCQAFCPVCD